LINTSNPTKGIVFNKGGNITNQDFPSKGEQTPTNIDPPHNDHQMTPKKWHYMGH
jgi:hypothetical protein